MRMARLDVVEVGERLIARTDDPVVWCLHCQRCSYESEWVGRRNGHWVRLCPYPRCDGDWAGDAWDWVQQRTCHGTAAPRADMPVVPLRGVRYEVA